MIRVYTSGRSVKSILYSGPHGIYSEETETTKQLLMMSNTRGDSCGSGAWLRTEVVSSIATLDGYFFSSFSIRGRCSS